MSALDEFLTMVVNDCIDGVPFVDTQPLRCALCGQDGPKLGKLPELARVGWKPGTAFHPYCSDNLNKYGAH